MDQKTPCFLKLEKTLGPLEYKVMKFLWNKDKATVREILSLLKKEKNFAYTTIMTVMNHLYEKNFLTRKKIKKTHYYSPLANEKTIIRKDSKNIVRELVENSGKREVFLSLLILIFPQVNFSFLDNAKVKPYKTPFAYGFSFTSAVLIFSFFLAQLISKFSSLETIEYLKLVKNEPSALFSRFNLFILALWESLPILETGLTVFFSILILVLVKKMAKLLTFKNSFKFN